MNIEALIDIALGVIAPVIVMAAVGFLLGWLRVIDPEPVAKIYMTVFAPALAFKALLAQNLTGHDLGRVLLFCFVSVAALFVLARLVSRGLGHDRGMKGAFANSVVLYNSANYGFPVQELAFPGLGPLIQPIVLMTQSIVAFTLGPFNAASNSPSLWATARRLVTMPLTWALVLGAALHLAGVTWDGLKNDVPVVWTPLNYFQGALVPVAVVTGNS